MTLLHHPQPGQPVLRQRPSRQEAEGGERAATRRAGDGKARVRLDLDDDAGAWWCRIRGTRRTLTPALLADMERTFDAVRHAGEARQFLVLDAEPAGPFSLGLDMAGLAGLLRLGDRASLSAYLGSYAAVLHGAASALDRPVVTAALLRGDAVGAGFELALACDLVVAERGTRFGLAEPLLGLPDTGALLLAARRIGAEPARRLVGSGRLHGAEDLHELGLVDVLAEPGEGEAAARDALARIARRHNAQQAVYAVKRRVSPVSRADIDLLAQAFVEAALALEPAARRNVERLAVMQGNAAAGQSSAEWERKAG